MFIILLFSKNIFASADFTYKVYAQINIFIYIQFFWLYSKQQKVKNNNKIFPKNKSFTELLNW